MTKPRKWQTLPSKRFAVTAVSCLLFTLLPVNSFAWADTQGEYWRTLNDAHSAHWAWYAPGENEMLKLSIVSGALPNARCVDSWFDWEPGGVPQPHYDARVTRTCKDNSLRAANQSEWWLEPTGTGRDLEDAFKVFVCLYNKDTNRVMLQQSVIVRGGDPGLESVNPNYTKNEPNNVTRAWHRAADGDAYIADRGFPARSDK